MITPSDLFECRIEQVALKHVEATGDRRAAWPGGNLLECRPKPTGRAEPTECPPRTLEDSRQTANRKNRKHHHDTNSPIWGRLIESRESTHNRHSESEYSTLTRQGVNESSSCTNEERLTHEPSRTKATTQTNRSFRSMAVSKQY